MFRAFSCLGIVEIANKGITDAALVFLVSLEGFTGVPGESFTGIFTELSARSETLLAETIEWK